MEKESIMPAGSMFLPGTGKRYLRQVQRRETDPKAASRLLAYAMRKDGMSIRQICRALNKPYSTIRNWLVRAAERGISGRHDTPGPGSPCRLDGGQLAQLRTELIAGPRRCGFESGVWTAPLVVQHVKRTYGVPYADRGMCDFAQNRLFVQKTKAQTPQISLKIPDKGV